MAFLNGYREWESRKRELASIKPSFKRKERESILTKQESLDLRANVIRAEETLKGIQDECELLELQQTESKKAYKAAKRKLSKIAAEKAIFEAESNEVGDELCERYRQAKISFITEKQRYEKLKTKSVTGKKEAGQNLKLAQEELKDFLCVHEKKIIVEKEELEKELEEAKQFKGDSRKAIHSIKDDLNHVMKALSLVCSRNGHIYEKIDIEYYGGGNHAYEIFRCKRCEQIEKNISFMNSE